MKTDSEFQEFVDSYLECLLWLAYDPNDENMETLVGYDNSDIDADAMNEIVTDCEGFWHDNAKHAVFGQLLRDNPEQAGHDFCLTRNGHGAGFWDRPDLWGEEGSKILSDKSRVYGSQVAYLGIDGKLYVHG